MHAIDCGFWSLVPPILAIVLALCTKEVISSLLVGILSGSFIYALYKGKGFVYMSSVAFTTISKTVGSPDKFNIILFLSLLGTLVYVVTKAGGSKAYGEWASTKLKSRKTVQLATSALGVLIFIDDYFNCLTVGTVMKPVTDKFKISRAKLAYIIDATAAPVCIIAPVSSWAAAVGSTLVSTGGFSNEMSAFLATIPYNLYALLTIFMVLFLSVTNLEFGPMEKVEYEAQKTGDLGAIDKIEDAEDEKSEKKGRVLDLVLPIVALIIFSILAMLWSGGMFSGKHVTFAEAFGNCNSSASLVLGSFWALLFTFCLFIPRKLLTFHEFMAGVGEGIKSMVPAFIILTLAWSIGSLCQNYLGTGEFVGHVIRASHLPLTLIPAIVFAVAAGLSFSIGTAWGTFAIFIPIVVFICQASAPELMTVTLSATLAGSVFGDHCSPISDTTILSSAGAGCNHIQHVSTQLPYAATVAVCCFFGYLVSGLTYGNVVATLASGFALLIIALVILHRRSTGRLKEAIAEGKA